jgi:hypothetical protein
MSEYWLPSKLDNKDLKRLRQSLRLIEGRQSRQALNLAEECTPSDSRDLTRAYALDRLGRDEEALRLLVPLVLRRDSELTRQGHKFVFLTLRRVARRGKSPLANILEGHDDTEQGDAVSRIVESFYFRRVGNEQSTLYHQVLERAEELKVRRRVPPSIPRLTNRIEFLKHYSSYTPLTELSDRSLGGGYFLVVGGFGCVIDPGYNFIGNFSKRHSVADIDAIVVTHCHDDHNADLPGLLSLFYRQRPAGKKVQLLLDSHTYEAQKHIILSSDYIVKPCAPIAASFDGWSDDSRAVRLGEDIAVQPIPARHRLTKGDGGNSAVGLHFVVGSARRDCHLVISGDTAWDRASMRDIYRGFAAYRPILVAHVSTACEKEALGVVGLSEAGYHDNHLGIRGTVEMIEACNPSKVVLSEIGEELGGVIDEVASLIEAEFKIPTLVGMMGDPKGEIVSLAPDEGKGLRPY